MSFIKNSHIRDIEKRKWKEGNREIQRNREIYGVKHEDKIIEVTLFNFKYTFISNSKYNTSSKTYGNRETIWKMTTHNYKI